MPRAPALSLVVRWDVEPDDFPGCRIQRNDAADAGTHVEQTVVIGVFCQLFGAVAPDQIVLSSEGTADSRQAMDSLPTVSLLIWSSGEYFVLALSAEYAGQLWIFSSLPAAFHAAPTASAATSHQCLVFMIPITVTATSLGKKLSKDIVEPSRIDTHPTCPYGTSMAYLKVLSIVLAGIPGVIQVAPLQTKEQAAVIDFVQKTVVQALDYRQGDRQSLVDAQDAFTADGWREFMKRMEGWLDSNGAPLGNSSFTPSGAAAIIDQENGLLHLEIPGALKQSDNISAATYRVVVDVRVRLSPLKITHLEPVVKLARE
jgi:hypothetical protein